MLPAQIDGEKAAGHARKRSDGEQRSISSPALLGRKNVRNQRLARREHERQPHASATRPDRGLETAQKELNSEGSTDMEQHYCRKGARYCMQALCR